MTKAIELADKLDYLADNDAENWQPLTDDQIFEIADSFGEFKYGDAQGDKRNGFARAIESAHGIKGVTE